MWGVPERKPCVFLKLKNPKQEIKYYTNATALPDDMPQDLKAHIRENPVKVKITLICVGEMNDLRIIFGILKAISLLPHV